MKKIFQALSFDRKEIDTYLILLSAPVLLSIWWCYGKADALGRCFPDLLDDPLHDFYGYLWQFFAFFVLVFVIPVLFIKYRLKRPLKDFGFGLGDRKFGFIGIAVTIPFLVVPVLFAASRLPEVRHEYPLARVLFQRHDLVVWYELAYILFYYVAWEFFFRGFLLFGLKERFGTMNAVIIQIIPSCLIHLGKPESELFGSIVIGVVFAAIALRTRSFWYVLMLHAANGVLNDLFVLFL